MSSSGRSTDAGDENLDSSVSVVDDARSRQGSTMSLSIEVIGRQLSNRTDENAVHTSVIRQVVVTIHTIRTKSLRISIIYV